MDPCLLGVLSDTHGHLENTRRAAEQFRRQAVGVVLHCGDIGSPQVPRLLADWPCHFVLGNVDYDGPSLQQAIAASSGHCHGRAGRLNLAGLSVAWLHGDDTHLLQATLQNPQYDLVCSGHTHRFEQRWEGATLVLNPGAVARAHPPTCAVVDLRTRLVTRIEL